MHVVQSIAVWIVFIFRLIIGIFTRTTFVPDEYYQVVEPAFKASFSIGFTTWEWFLKHKIRSFLTLLPVIWLYEVIIYFVAIEYTELITELPRVLQSLLAAYADVHLFFICETVVDTKFAWCAIIIHCLSWSSAYLLSRALANSTEASLIIIGVSFLLQLQQSENNRNANKSNTHFLSCSAVIIASISAYSRPTSLFFWIPLFLFQFSVLKRPLRFLIHYCIPIAVLIIEFAISIDSFYYESFAFTPLNFYVDNITHNYAALFGVNSWHWNFTNGIPVILGLYTPLLVYSVLYTKLPTFIFRLLYTSLFYIVMLTVMSPHQEYRFLLPCLPWMHLCIAYTVYDVLYGSSCIQSVDSDGALTGKEARHMHNGIQGTRRTIWKYVLGTIAILHMVAVFYLIRYHQSGTEVALIKIAKHIRATSHQSASAGNNKHIVPVHSPPPSIILAAPCYSFPGYAYVYTTRYPVRMYMHECSPGNASSFDADILGNVQQLIDAAWTGNSDAITETTQQSVATTDQQSKEGIHSTSQHQYLVTFDAYLPALQSLIDAYHFEQLYVVQHALFRYDYDDPYSKKTVHVFYRIQGSMNNGNCPII